MEAFGTTRVVTLPEPDERGVVGLRAELSAALAAVTAG